MKLQSCRLTKPLYWLSELAAAYPKATIMAFGAKTLVNSEWAQVEVIELQNDGGGLAFGIIGGRSTGVVVKTILPGGVADRDGRLQSGDHILRIGEVSMRGLGCEQAAAVLRQCGVRVRLLVARPADPQPDYRSLGASNAPIVPTKVLGDPDELDRHLVESGYAESVAPPPPEPALIDRYEDRYVYRRGGGADIELLPISSIVDVVKNPLPVGPVMAPVPPAPATVPAVPMLPLDMAVRPELAGIPQLPEMETFQVQLKKDVYGLGITVAGYVCEQEELSGIFVKSISTGSSADLCNKIQINDRIVEVDFKPLQAVSNHQAVELLRGTGPIVHLKLERFLRGPRYEKLQKALKAQGVTPGPPSPSVTSLPRCPATMYEESSVIDTELDSRATVDSPHPTSPVTPPPEDVEIVIGAKENREDSTVALRAIQDKWREILSLEPDSPAEDDIEIVVGTMIKEPGGGLGISLEGTVEVENGREVRPHHYIRSLLQDGPVGRSGRLQAGDELLEVNGRRLLGLHHLEVVKSLKQLPASVCLVCARRPSRRALIDTAQHRDAFAARNILGGSLQNFLPLPERMIKAKSESSIASMCSTNTTITPNNIREFIHTLFLRRSRSLEPMSGLAMWSDQPEYIELVKSDRGLGFSILDYQDPVEPKGTVIVVRSVVAGGAAARAGTLRPGDRLLSVNGQSLNGASLAHAVQALKSAHKGIVRIGVAKPLPSSSLGSADRCKRNDSVSSQEGANSAGSDDHTGFDSYHECLQEYQECLEVVQICLEPEDPSLREDDMSNLEDFSFEEMKNDYNCVNGLKSKNNKSTKNGVTNGDKNRFERITKDSSGNEFYNVRDLISDNIKYPNGNQCDSIKLSETRKSDDSLDGNDEDMTITEDDPELALRTLSSTKTLTDPKINQSDRSINRKLSLSKGNSKDLSTSDEMVFAVTPTGLERVNFDRYWKEGDIEESSKEDKIVNPDSMRSDESWKDCTSQMAESNLEKSLKSSLQNTHLLFIDHDFDGYDTCLEDDSSLIKVENALNNTNAEKIELESNANTKESLKHDTPTKENILNTIQTPVEEAVQSVDESKNESPSSLNDNTQFFTLAKVETSDQINKNVVESEPATEPNNIHQLNNNVTEVLEKTQQCVNNNVKPEAKVAKVHRIRVVEYYNDEAECLEEYKRQMKIEEERLRKEKQEKTLKVARETRTKNFLMNKHEPSEESTDQETNCVVAGCHKCFLESYAYEITKAYYAEASKCKFCAVVKEILEPPKRLLDRSSSSPAILEISSKKTSGRRLTSHGLIVPDSSKDRRQSAGPLKFFIPSIDSDAILKMTVSRDKYTASPTVGTADSSTNAMEKHWGQARQVAVQREPNTSLGISIVGGKVDISSTSGEAGDVIISGIFIKNVVPNSPAGHCGQLRTGDRILEVDGVDVRTASHEKAVQIIRAAGNPVKFLIQSLLPWNTDSSDIDSQKMVTSSTDTISGSPPAKSPSPKKATLSPAHNVEVKVPEPLKAPHVEITAPDSDSPSEEPKPDNALPSIAPLDEPVKKLEVVEQLSPSTPVEPTFVEKKENNEKIIYSDDEDSEDEEDEDRRELEGRTCSEKGIEIDRASAGNVKRTKEEKEADPEEEDDFGYTNNKVKKKYSNLGHTVVAVRLERGPRGGLGISLAGHRDRSRMAVFVCGLRPGGAASRAGSVLVGDEILEVNGVVLHGRCHLNASAIIKGLAGPIFKVILLRRIRALEDVAVKPITQFPVTLEDETDENRYATYKNVKTVTIKKGSQSLGIMIIEGRHAEVGQGIFISDIQEGSAAEQAGLAIGDMILAVNKDTLLGSNYDAAASMLKKTEGVVVLLVCNPNKKDDSGSTGALALEEPPPPGTPARPGSTTPAKPGTATPAKTESTLKGPTHISRPSTPAGKLSLASPAKAEPVADPTTAPIVSGKESLIDITTDSKPLGINIVGGQDTLIPGGVVLLEVYPDGKAAKDGRLKPGDQILDCNGVKITPEMKQEKALSLIKQTVPKMKMTVFRPEPVSYSEIDVDLMKKPGKGLGLGVMAKKPPPGVYISELIHGGIAEVDGRLQRGDIIISVAGQNLKEATCEEAAAALKCAQAKVSIKVARHKLAR
ncbi:multiple PDZ domain protein-like [Arctopsyche grandis]|uniref:multiple PDZ domain protein-like n=1 Tax=Arctopsyche grandis TaxID=121162 RepID=UPI00406D943D